MKRVMLPDNSFPELDGVNVANTAESMWSKTANVTLESCYSAAKANYYNGLKKGLYTGAACAVGGIALGLVAIAVKKYLKKKYENK